MNSKSNLECGYIKQCHQLNVQQEARAQKQIVHPLLVNFVHTLKIYLKLEIKGNLLWRCTYTKIYALPLFDG